MPRPDSLLPCLVTRSSLPLQPTIACYQSKSLVGLCPPAACDGGLAIYESFTFPWPLGFFQVRTRQIRVNLRNFAEITGKDVLSPMVSDMVDLSLELQMAVFSLCRNASKIKSAPRKAALRYRERRRYPKTAPCTWIHPRYFSLASSEFPLY